MSSPSNTKKTVLEIVNEVQRKVGIPNEATSLTSNSLSTLMVDYLNDVISIINDYGDWPDAYSQINIPMVTNQSEYVLNVPINAKDIKELNVSGQIQSLLWTNISEMRRFLRIPNSTGLPIRWALFSVDPITDSPVFNVWPAPSSFYNGTNLVVWYYTRPSLLTTDDANTLINFPSTVVAQGLLARVVLGDNRGAANNDAEKEEMKFKLMLEEAYNRLTSDSGTSVKLICSKVRR